MLPDFSFFELLVVGVVALVVVGPRDLPKLARTLGGYVRQARQMAREFQKSFDDMGRELELQELRKEVDALKRGEPFDDIKKEIKAIDQDMKEVDRDVRRSTAPPATTPAATSGAAAKTDAPAAPAETPAESLPPPSEPSTQTAGGEKPKPEPTEASKTGT